MTRAAPRPSGVSAPPVADRLGKLDWKAIEEYLWTHACAKTASVLSRQECESLVALYSDESRFRSRVEMERHRFGLGDYKYFAYPLPPLVQELRTHAYPPLAAIANAWMEALGAPPRYPPTLEAFLGECAAKGQTKPTPLLLHYEAGGYNCLHQDVYGDVGFPLQIAAFLSRPGEDYAGGEFLVVEQRPRAQSVGEAIVGEQGELLIFTNRLRPVAAARGHYRANVRHGVSGRTSPPTGSTPSRRGPGGQSKGRTDGLYLRSGRRRGTGVRHGRLPPPLPRRAGPIRGPADGLRGRKRWSCSRRSWGRTWS